MRFNLHWLCFPRFYEFLRPINDVQLCSTPKSTHALYFTDFGDLICVCAMALCSVYHCLCKVVFECGTLLGTPGLRFSNFQAVVLHVLDKP